MSVQTAPKAPPAPDYDRPMMTEEAAEFCRLSRAQMIRMRSQGIGPKFVRLGARILYLRPDLKEWLYANRVMK